MKKLLIATLSLLAASAQAETRGLALLPLKHPNFPVRQACDILKSSPSPSFSFIADVTFGTSDRNVHTLIRCIKPYADSRPNGLRVHAYVLTGPARRPRRNGSVPHSMPHLTISEFNAKLRLRDGRVAKAYVRRVQLLKILVDHYPDIVWVVTPELEDNLTREGFSYLKRLTARVFEGYPNVLITRNPLVPQRGPEPTEIHTFNPERIKTLRRGDTVSGDGVDYWPTMESVRVAERMGIHWHFWQPSMQGITRNPNVHPSKRTYRFTDIPRIKRLLRG